MKPSSSLLIACMLIMASCSSTTKVVQVDAAAREMKIADSLEGTSEIREAALRYSSIAERFPGSRFYQTAVREAALLHSSPLNDAIDDSASLYWLQVYTSQPISKEEKESAVVRISLLHRIGTLQQEIDSLKQYSKKQTAEMTARANRIHEMETQMKQTTDELKKLRDIDVKVYRRGKKK